MKSDKLFEVSKPWLKTVKHTIIVTRELSINLYNVLKSSYEDVEICILLMTNVWNDEEKNRVKFFEENGFIVRLITLRKEGKNEK